MPLKPIIFLLGFSLALSLPVQNNNPETPLTIYLSDMQEMGQTLGGWSSDSLDEGTWFFGSYAMLLLSNNGRGENVPYSGLESAIPALWSDFKYLTPRYLVELAGGALSNGRLMSIQEDLAFDRLTSEEKFIVEVAGFAYLRMLYGTLGDTLFSRAVKDAIQNSERSSSITRELVKSTGLYGGKGLARQFELALTSSQWSDENLKVVQKHGDSLEIHIEHLGVWHFPVEVLAISSRGDSSKYLYELDQNVALVIPGRDIEKIVLDPDHFLAEYFRYNNQWPRLKNNIHFQPFGALPDWSSYRVTINPKIWSDWDEDKRFGIKFTSGFGVDLWPAYPSDYRHRISLEINAHEPRGEEMNWGGRLSYGHPLNLEKRLFSDITAHMYDDWTGYSIGMKRYVGEQTYLIQGPRLTYQRVTLAYKFDHYADTLIWKQKQEIKILKGSYSGLSVTGQGDRVYLKFDAASGEGPQGNFSIFKAQADLSGVFWGWVVGGVQFETGLESGSTPHPYQFSHDYRWQDGLSAMPNFRGQNKMDESTNEYMGLNVSGGYWLSGIQIKLFTSSMIVDMNSLGWKQVKPHYAAGFGFEHKSFFTAGLYFPVWQSQPLEGESSWAWRYQWHITWNL